MNDNTKDSQNVPYLVTFAPDGKITSAYIQSLNNECERLDGQTFSTIMASSVSAIAFMMMTQNTPEKIKELFGAVIDDAAERFKRRQDLINNQRKPNDG